MMLFREQTFAKPRTMPLRKRKTLTTQIQTTTASHRSHLQAVLVDRSDRHEAVSTNADNAEPCRQHTPISPS
jgi:hypothetical protein